MATKVQKPSPCLTLQKCAEQYECVPFRVQSNQCSATPHVAHIMDYIEYHEQEQQQEQEQQGLELDRESIVQSAKEAVEIIIYTAAFDISNEFILAGAPQEQVL